MHEKTRKKCEILGGSVCMSGGGGTVLKLLTEVGMCAPVIICKFCIRHLLW
jgi:hypothetical protein